MDVLNLYHEKESKNFNRLTNRVCGMKMDSKSKYNGRKFSFEI